MKFRLPLIILPLLASCGTNAPATYTDALSSFEAKQYLDARIELMNLVQQNPTDGKIRLLRAKNFMALGDGIAAQASLEQAVERGIDPDTVGLLRAEALLLQNRPNDAMKLLNLAERDESEDAYRLRSAGFVMLEQIESAEQELKKGLQIYPKNLEMLTTKARIFMKRDEIKKADQIAKQLTQIDQNAIETLLLNADIASRRDDWKAALKWYEKAELTYPHNLAAQIGKIATLGDLGRLKEMEKKLGGLLKVSPKNAVLLFLKAKLKAKGGDWRSASSLISQIDGDLSSDPEVMILAGEAAVNLKNFEAARVDLSRVLAAEPGNAHARLHLAKVYEGLGDMHSAREALRPVTEQKSAGREALIVMARLEEKLGGENARFYAERAKFPSPEILAQKLISADRMLRAKRWPAAVKEYKELERLTGGADAVIMNNLAWSLFKNGQPKQALVAANKAYKLAPKNGAVADSYGWIMFNAKQDDQKALALIRQAVSLKPDDGNFRWHLVQVLERTGAGGEAKQEARKLLSTPKFKGNIDVQKVYARL